MVVGPLAHEGVSYLKAAISDVSISRESLIHIDKKHFDITDFEIITMAYGLQNGLFISDIRKENCLIINYIYPDNRIRYKMVIKSAANGTELWVSTFHRLRERQTKALLSRGHIIKKHK